MVRNRTRFCEHANQILRNFVLNSARNRTRFCASPVPESAGITSGCPQSYPQFERSNRGAPVFFCHRRTHFCVRKRNWSRSGLGYRADRTRFCGSGRGAVCTKRTQICVVLTDGPICAPTNMGIARKQAHASAIRGKFGPYPILRACCGGCLRDRGGRGPAVSQLSSLKAPECGDGVMCRGAAGPRAVPVSAGKRLVSQRLGVWTLASGVPISAKVGALTLEKPYPFLRSRLHVEAYPFLRAVPQKWVRFAACRFSGVAETGTRRVSPPGRGRADSRAAVADCMHPYPFLRTRSQK